MAVPTQHGTASRDTLQGSAFTRVRAHTHGGTANASTRTISYRASHDGCTQGAQSQPLRTKHQQLPPQDGFPMAPRRCQHGRTCWHVRTSPVLDGGTFKMRLAPWPHLRVTCTHTYSHITCTHGRDVGGQTTMRTPRPAPPSTSPPASHSSPRWWGAGDQRAPNTACAVDWGGGSAMPCGLHDRSHSPTHLRPQVTDRHERVRVPAHDSGEHTRGHIRGLTPRETHGHFGVQTRMCGALGASKKQVKAHSCYPTASSACDHTPSRHLPPKPVVACARSQTRIHAATFTHS
jgi:hypothetical protein